MNLDFHYIKSVLNIYDEMLTNGFSLVYLGEFSHEITKMFTSMAESDMDRHSEEKVTRRRVYHVMVETLQNMNKHSDEIADKKSVGKGLFIIGKKNEIYYIITANKVANDKRDSLAEAIKIVNAATPEQLRTMYRKQMRDGSLSEKGGAGLGLIDIARKTGEPLHYHFIPLNEDHCFFILEVEINAKNLSQRREKRKKEKNENNCSL